MTEANPDSLSWVRIIIAFAVVFGLLGIMGFGLKYINERGLKLPRPLAERFGQMRGQKKRLELVESLPLDIRRRLVIVRCDDTEHLLLLGVNQDILVSGIKKPSSAPRDQDMP